MPITNQVDHAASTDQEEAPLNAKKPNNFGTFPQQTADHLYKINHCCAEGCDQEIQLMKEGTRLIMVQQSLSGSAREQRHFGYTCSNGCFDQVNKNLTHRRLPHVFIQTIEYSTHQAKLLDPEHKTLLRDLNNSSPSELKPIISGIFWKKTSIFKAIEKITAAKESTSFLERYAATLKHNEQNPNNPNYLQKQGNLAYVSVKSLDLSYLKIIKKYIMHCTFSQCLLGNTQVFLPSTLLHTTFFTCDIRITFKNIKLQSCTFNTCNFTGSTFIDCEFDTNSTFSNCTFKDADLSNAGLQNSRFEGHIEFINCKISAVLIATLERNRNVTYEIVDEEALLTGRTNGAVSSMEVSPDITPSHTPPRETTSPSLFASSPGHTGTNNTANEGQRLLLISPNK